ncbi:MAG TPA: class I SAM-dependent methyltransferase [Candidatus Dormibacteraeota bacterium]|nr:class I SAM-dependent methyltransferase [Candidatus Dormibacteraeota bacterium]
MGSATVRAAAEWDRWGADLYFANTGQREHRGRVAEEVFAQGEAYLDRVESRFAALGVPVDHAGAALDFGCGVGRVLVPMSRRYARTVGVDVAETMLAEARRHLGGGAAELLHYDGDDIDGCLGEMRFDVLHTARTVQHIPPDDGVRILRSLLERLRPGGVALVQAPMCAPRTLFHRLNALRERSPLLIRVGHALARGRTEFRPTDPVHHWHLYSADRLLPLFHACGCEVRAVDLDPDPRGRHRATWYLHRVT